MKNAILISVLAAGPAFAENVEVFVVQEDGSGVVQYESITTFEEAAVLIDAARPADATGVVLQNGEPVKWTALSAQDINEHHGGDGEPYIQNRADAEQPSELEFDVDEERQNQQTDDEMTFDADEERHNQQGDDDSDIDFTDTKDLLPGADTLSDARIRPQSGYWVIDIREQTFTNCAPRIEEAARAQMAAMNTSGAEGNYGPDFTPEKMAPQLEWTQVGTNTWLGVLDMLNGSSGVYFQWGVQVISPTLIENRQQLNFVMPGMGNCEVYTEVYAAWVN